MPRRPVKLLLRLLLLLPVAAHSQQLTPPDWRALAIADLDALHHSVTTLHPGFRDPQTPDFAARVETAYRASHLMAERAQSQLEWRNATTGFMLSFRDGHTIYRVIQPPGQVRWPGFLIDSQAGKYVARKPANLPGRNDQVPEGSELVSCDGVPIATLLESTLDKVEVDWSKEPERIRQAYRFFLDVSAEGRPRAAKCLLKTKNGNSEIALKWRLEAWSTLAPSLGTFNGETRRAIERKTLPDGSQWITLGSFGDEEKLTALAATLKADVASLRRAPYIVFDVRGNRGGNSTWGETFANILYGETDSPSPGPLGKFWRASPEAEREVRTDAARFAARGEFFRSVAEYWTGIAELIHNAPKGDSALVSDPCCEPSPPPARSQPTAIPAYPHPVFILTDAGCFSSCVVAVETLKQFGAIQIGETTGQNEEYGETAGPLTTPSGLARYFIPICIIRQNKSSLRQAPQRLWTGAMDDDPALEAWVRTLTRQK